jgi:hypothetical protein
MFHLSEKSGKPGSAVPYLAYITRERRRQKGLPTNDLYGTWWGNLPAWSRGDPFYFFEQSDKHERVNGAAFRANEISLPRQLHIETGVKAILELIPELLGSRPWFVAVHDSVGLSGERNPHVHLMFSDRACDGISRTPGQYFARFNAAFPELGGACKLTGGKHPAAMGVELRARREKVAGHFNRILMAHGFPPTMDPRTLEERALQHVHAAGASLYGTSASYPVFWNPA